MPHLTLQFSLGGPQIDLVVGLSTPRKQALIREGKPVPPDIKVRALIDTGASGTCIDSEIIKKLSLQPTGTVPIATPSTTASSLHSANQYDISLMLVHPSLSWTQHALPVIEAALKYQGIDVLLGRDILKKCLFVYDGENNVFSLGF